MNTDYKVHLRVGTVIIITAYYFEVTENNVLLFYKEGDSVPFRAYNSHMWDYVE